MTHPSEQDPGRYGRLRLSTRIRNRHRKARRAGEAPLGLKQWARKLAEGASADERSASADALDRKQKLSPAALAWHWPEKRGLAA